LNAPGLGQPWTGPRGFMGGGAGGGIGGTGIITGGGSDGDDEGGGFRGTAPPLPGVPVKIVPGEGLWATFPGLGSYRLPKKKANSQSTIGMPILPLLGLGLLGSAQRQYGCG